MAPPSSPLERLKSMAVSGPQPVVPLLFSFVIQRLSIAQG
jgi:hypothetical protein